jgi:hypothetical protein
MTRARAAGVALNSQTKKWRASIFADTGDGVSKTKYLGAFVDEVDAALAYDQAAREQHGDKAQLNFPDMPPQPQLRLTLRQAVSQYRGKSRCIWAPRLSP